MWNLVTVAVENCDVIVGLERVGCDYHNSTIEMVQVLGRRLEGAGGMRMRYAHYTEIHWEHHIRESRESSPMRGQGRN